MKAFSILYFSISFISSYCFGQVVFQKTYTTPGGTIGYSGCLTNDGGYILAGSSFSLNGINKDIYVTKVNEFGTIEWTRTYGNTSKNEWGYSIKQTFDNGYIIAGSADSAYLSNFYLLKIDSLGSVMWVHDFGTLSKEYGVDVEQSSDSGFVIIGKTDNEIFPALHNDLYVIKTDKFGNLVWNKTYFGIQADEGGASIHLTNDGGYILTGYKGNFINYLTNFWLIKINAVGNQTWAKTYGIGSGKYGKQTSDGGYILTGIYGSGSNSQILLIKTDSIGIVQWEKVFERIPMYNIPQAVQQTSDGGFIVTGQTGNFGAYDVFLIKTDAVGDTLWTRFFDNGGNDVGYDVFQTPDNGYAVLGCSGLNAYLIKTDSNGHSGCNEIDISFWVNSYFSYLSPLTSMNTFVTSSSSPSILIDSSGSSNILCFSVGSNSIFENVINQILPNPNTGNFTIVFSENIFQGKVEIYNILGERIFSDILYLEKKKEINLENANSGIYIAYIYDGEHQYRKKFVIERN